jgi:large subunit ribosomal protein L17
MRHQSKGRKFGRKSGPRNALKRDVVNSLFRHGRIVTTLPRAKEFRPYAERMITVAKRGAAARAAKNGVVALNAYRKLLSELHDETIVAKLIAEVAPQFADRSGGYTRIVRIANPRKGDAAPTAVFELVTYVPPAPEGESGEDAAATGTAEKAPAAK